MTRLNSSDYLELVSEFTFELEAISNWWSSYAVDHMHGGFLGEVSNEQYGDHFAPKGVVATARILWFFSEAALSTGEENLKTLAERAYRYIASHFWDVEHGGVFWSVNPDRSPADTKKQTYAQAFVIYGYVSYYKLTGDKSAIIAAQDLYDLIENWTFEADANGYNEALSRNWKSLSDVRLSEYDSNYPFTMNTHLHLMEAYSALYEIRPTDRVRLSLENLIEIHLEKIIFDKGARLGMFFDKNWNDKSSGISHGHNIEASWLIWEASQILNNDSISQRVEKVTISLANACYEQAFAGYGYVINETTLSGEVDSVSVWWVQAEALVGFLNAYVLTDDSRFLNAAKAIWAFTKENHIDHNKGEWFWNARNHEAIRSRSYKAGMWKAPYHNGRAMLESVSILKELSLRAIPDDRNFGVKAGQI